MAVTEKKENKLKDKYRLIIYNDNSLKEVGFLRLTGFNLLWIIGLVTVLLVSIVFIMVAYTSIRELIPGYPDSIFRRNMVENALRLDSLENELRVRDQYFTNINKIISGKDTTDTGNVMKGNVKIKSVSFTKSEKDSEFRKQIELEEQFNVSMNNPGYQQPKNNNNIGYNLFFTPIPGIVSQSYNTKHYGIDVVAKANEVVKSVLDGTVIFSTWTIETGYTITIQHENNFISIYKHNSELLKKVGTFVHAGEAIAIIGNSGELTTGPHLHFELWYNGQPVNPEDYIKF
jgi:murein DD-endopeptidase MepM/ murein hydrolase activator NlpD